MKESDVYLGVDPGSSKTGLALVDSAGVIHKLFIAHMDHFLQDVDNFCEDVELTAIILGDGTHSQEVAAQLQARYPDLQQYFVGEAYSTEAARKLYWEVNPPHGLKKLVPQGLLVPSEPLDAYAAVVQVRRWLKEHQCKN